MLTGRRAFEGEDVSSILAAVIQSEPRWDSVPANVRRLLESCLEKDPRRRLRDIGDVWKLLDDGPAVASRSRTGTPGWIAAGLLAVVAAMALWAPWRGARRRPHSHSCGLTSIWGRRCRWRLLSSRRSAPS